MVYSFSLLNTHESKFSLSFCEWFPVPIGACEGEKWFKTVSIDEMLKRHIFACAPFVRDYSSSPLYYNKCFE